MAVILPSVYQDGTSTVAAGGTAVTGQGTMWLNTILPGDFYGIHKGFPTRIASVNSNTSLTLADAYGGGAQTAAPYAIMYQGDNARIAETTRQLLEKLSGGNLDSLAGLVGAANDIPMFTGPGVFGKIASGAKGRTLITSPSTLDTLSKLGPVFGGPAPVPSSADVGMADGDFNSLIYPGVYSISGNWTNGPFGAGSFAYNAMVEITARVFNNLYIQIFRRNTGLVYRRWTTTSGGTSWPNPWEVIESPTVGTVSQSSGVPFGAVIERGSNANGEYVRFADGTQICTSPSTVYGTTENPTGSVYLNTSGTLTWTFPIAFTGTVSATIGGTGSSFRWGTTISANTTSAQFRVFSSVTSTASLSFGAMAIGRWF